MAAPDLLTHGPPGFSLPAFERLAPAPSPEALAMRIEAYSKPGDVIVDLFGRGGWVARAALDRQRRSASFELSPLTRLLAEIVLRPPDIRHLDAAFQVISTSPSGQTTLKAALGELFATQCATCGRTVTIDELVWETDPADAGRRASHPIRKHYRCSICRDQLGGSEQRHSAIDEADIARAHEVDEHSRAWRILRERFPIMDGNEALVEQLLGLHTPRQLVGLHAILERIDGDLRAAPVEAALRLALVQALLPATRLNGFPGRIANLRIVGGRVRVPAGGQWRERNPWLAFEDGFRLVRGFVQRLEGSATGVVQARFREDLRSLAETPSGVLVRVGSPAVLQGLADESLRLSGAGPQARVRLILGQPPLRPSQDRLSSTYFATAWVLGFAAAEKLPLAPLFRSTAKLRFGWQSAQLERTFAAAAPILTRDARAVLLLEEGGAEALVAAVLGVVGAGYRLVAARLDSADEGGGGVVELVPPGAGLPPVARTRANVTLPPLPGGAGDPDMVAGRGMFSAPERVSRGPFSSAEAAKTVTEAVVEILKARGEPAGYDRLLGEILVALDRAGHLRRLVTSDPEADGTAAASTGEQGAPDGPGAPNGPSAPNGSAAPNAPAAAAARAASSHSPMSATSPVAAAGTGPAGAGGSSPLSAPRPPAVAPSMPSTGPVTSPFTDAATSLRGGGADGIRARRDGPTGAQSRGDAAAAASRAAHQGDWTRDIAGERWNEALDRILEVIRTELERPDNRRLRQIEPGSWWLGDKEDRAGAALPLGDRVEWSVFSLLSTAGKLSQPALFERVEAMFTGHDRPDESLIRACVDSYRSAASTPGRLTTAEELPRRSQETSELIGLLTDLGHRQGMSVWIGAREQSRTVRGVALGELLSDRELRVNLGAVIRAPEEEIEQIPCLWYVRGKVAFSFEIEWTAMLGEPLLRRHSRIPPDEKLIRFLVIAAERTELIRYKLTQSALLRQSLAGGNWHIIKSEHLRALAERDDFSLGDLEPYLGLDPPIEGHAEQMALFS